MLVLLCPVEYQHFLHTNPVTILWLFDRLGLGDTSAGWTIDGASHGTLVLDEGVEMDLSVPDLTGKWIPSWPCDSCSKHNLLNVNLMFAGTIEIDVLVGQKVILLLNFLYKKPLLTDMHITH